MSFLGFSGTYPGVQNRSLGSTFQKFGNFLNGPESVWEAPGGSQESPGPHTKILNVPEFFILSNLYFLMAYCIAYLPIVLPIELPINRLGGRYIN